MAKVELWGALREAMNDEASIEIEARTIGEMMRKLEERYPQLQSFIDEGIAVSINGTIYQASWKKELPEGAEIYLLPRIQGG